MAKIFISYSRKDSKWLEKLYTFLKPLLGEKDIELWSDHDIKPGENWSSAIETSLETATVAVIMLSANYMTSDYLKNHELLNLLDASQKRGMKLLPIVISKIDDLTTISHLTFLNSPDTPLNELGEKDLKSSLKQIVQNIYDSFNVEDEQKDDMEDDKKDLHQKAFGVAFLKSTSLVSGTGMVISGSNIFNVAEQNLDEGKENDG